MSVAAPERAETSSYEMPIPRMDGYRATRLEIRFSGAALLDPMDEDALAMLEAGRLGERVRLIVEGEFAGKGFRLSRKANGEKQLGFTATVQIASVEAGEIA